MADARKVDAAVSELRSVLLEWSARLGRLSREPLFISELSISAWWFSLLSDRGPLKTDAFLRLARLKALGTPAPLARSDDKPALVWLLRGAKLWLTLWKRGRAARRAFAGASRPAPSEAALAIATYFPALGPGLENRYFAPLQEALRKAGKEPLWLLQFVPLEGKTFDGALALARALNAQGQTAYFLEEFLLPEDVRAGIKLWLRLALRAGRLWRKLPKDALIPEALGGQRAEGIIKGLWERSFFGPPSVEGIAYALAFRRLCAALGPKGDFVYLSELLAWEKSLNAAKRALRPSWRTIGFQHGSILGNLFNYFHSPSETQETGPAALPLPDVFGTDGEIPEMLLSECCYPHLTRLEALRYIPLAKALSEPVRPRVKTVLVAGSIDPVEAWRLAEVVMQAFPPGGGTRVVFKGHPMTPFDVSGYEVAKGSLGELLREPGVMVTASSGAALEALAYGWEIVVPLFDDVMPMSPLSVAPGLARFVEGSEELMKAVEEAFSAESARAEAGRDFVRRYWDMDPALSRWRKLLTIG